MCRKTELNDARRSGQCDKSLMVQASALQALLLLSSARYALAQNELGRRVARRWRRDGSAAATGAELSRAVPWELSHMSSARPSPGAGGSLCADTCASAKNGVCDDASHVDVHAVVEVRCDIGTDCTDCGASHLRPYRPAPLNTILSVVPEGLPPPPPPPPSPVQLLRSRGVQVKAARTATQPSFIMPFTSGAKDFDVSQGMERCAARVYSSLCALHS